MLRAAVDAHVEDGAGGASVLGAVVVGFYAELADRVRRRLDGLVGEALVRCAVRVVVQAVEHEVIELAALAVHVVGSVAAGHRLVFQVVCADAWRQQRQIGVGATVQRKVVDVARGDDLPAFAVFSVEQGGCAGYSHRLGCRAGLQGHVDALARIHFSGEGFRQWSH